MVDFDKMAPRRGKSGTMVEDAPAAPKLDSAVTDAPKSLVAKGAYDGDTGSGFEDIGIADITIPFLTMLQSGSPQVKEDKGTYIKGAKAGMFMNTVTGEIIDGKVGFKFIPVHRQRKYIEWVPRDQGGGLVNVFNPTDEKVTALTKGQKRIFGKLSNADGNDVVETFTLFGLRVKDNSGLERVAISFSSSFIKVYQKMMTTLMNIQLDAGEGRDPVTPPLYAHVLRVRSQFVEKAGNDWYIPQIGFENGTAEESRLPQESKLYQEAKKFRGDAADELVVVDHAQADRGDAVDGDGAAPGTDFAM